MMCRGRIRWWQSRTVSAAPVAGWVFSAGKEIQPLLGLFSHRFYVNVPLQVLKMVLPRNLNDSTVITVLSMMVSGGFLLKSTIISTVFSVFSSRLLRLHKTASSLPPVCKADSSPSWSRSFAWQGSLMCSRWCRGKKSSGEENTALRSSSAARDGCWVCIFPALTSCCPVCQKLMIHWQTEVGTESWVSLGRRRFVMIVLKAELKSTNRSSHKSLVCPDAAGWSAVPCRRIIHSPVCSVGKLLGVQ